MVSLGIVVCFISMSSTARALELPRHAVLGYHIDFVDWISARFVAGTSEAVLLGFLSQNGFSDPQLVNARAFELVSQKFAVPAGGFGGQRLHSSSKVTDRFFCRSGHTVVWSADETGVLAFVHASQSRCHFDLW